MTTRSRSSEQQAEIPNEPCALANILCTAVKRSLSKKKFVADRASSRHIPYLEACARFRQGWNNGRNRQGQKTGGLPLRELVHLFIQSGGKRVGQGLEA